MINVKQWVSKAKDVACHAHHRIKEAIGGPPATNDMPLFETNAHDTAVSDTKEVCEILADLTPGQRKIALTILKFDS